jgi:hypothetical protein
MSNQQLKFNSVRNGFYRVYYTMGKKLYCFQESFKGHFESFECSQDGEPSHGVTFTDDQLMNIEKPQDSSAISFEFWRFIMKRQEEISDSALA